MKHNLFLLLLLLFFLLSCSSSTELEEEKGPVIPDIEEVEKPTLTFTPSPFNLNRIDAKFSKDISYGPYEENRFDIFIPNSTEPTPLVIYIHGGYFTFGDKTEPYSDVGWVFPNAIKTFLTNKIAFATINYRLLKLGGDDEGVLKPMSDSKRCLQYIRAISDVLNIDKNRIVLSGQSAGAGTSQWLGFSDDMADPNHSDPVMRESTRVRGVAVRSTQASYDLMRFESDIFDDFNLTLKGYLSKEPSLIPLIMSIYSLVNLEDFYSDRVIEYRKKVDMLGLMSKDDPALWVSNPQSPIVKVPTNKGELTHHAFHARTMKEWADSIGIPNVVYYDTYKDLSGEGYVDFVIRKLNEK